VTKIPRIVLALAIFLSGVALVPFVGLPEDGFRWQQYADAYNPLSLDINYETGAPGSYFTIRGYNFPSNTAITVTANGTVIGTLDTDGSGNLLFLIDSDGADTGFYYIGTNIIDGPTVTFKLDNGEPIRDQEDVGVTFNLPTGIALNIIHLPVILR
jgi:hypothetical protein